MQDPATDFSCSAAETMAALEYVPLPAALLDEDGIIRWQNKTSVALRGSRVGVDFVEFLAPEDRRDARSMFDRILGGGEPAGLAVRALNADGEYVFLEGRWSVVQLRNGRKVVVVLSLGDIDGVAGLTPQPERTVLTPRQIDVLRLLAAGKSTAEIAQDLGLRPTTVRNHIANILAVLGAHSRLQAVIAARKAGLIESDPD